MAGSDAALELPPGDPGSRRRAPVVGITGTGGAGKSPSDR